MENPLFVRKLNSPGPKELLLRYVRYVPLYLAFLAVAWFLTWLNLRYATPIYNVTGKILVKDDNPYNGSSEKFSAIFGLPNDNTNLNNEIEIIKSRSMALKVIRTYNLQVQYAIRGKIRTSEANAEDLPFTWIIEEIADSSKGVSFEITTASDIEFTINNSNEKFSFGQSINKNGIRFRLLPKKTSGWDQDENQYILRYSPNDKLAGGLVSELNVVKQEGSSVLNIGYNTANTKNGLVIVNGFMREYMLSGLEDKKQIAYNTLLFIDEQLDTLRKELGGVEKNLQEFRETNLIFNTEAQATESFNRFSESEKQIAEQGVKIKVVDYLVNYISDPHNSNKIVPSNLGIEEPSLVTQIAAYNEAQLRKETLLKTTTGENPIVKNLSTSAETLRSDILQNLNNVRNAYELANRELEKLNSRADRTLRGIPGKEKQLLEVTRRQAILQELYSFLLQKKLETAISSASTVSDIKILEPAIASNFPIRPNRKGMYTIAIFLGLAIPSLIIFLWEFLNDKVNSRLDIEEITEAPILGEIGHAEDAGALVVKENNRSYVAEQFRIIRSNLQFILPKLDRQIILVTSTFSGEGKSFISTNLGSVLALSGKKTVILEMDIRKPKILRGLGMKERKGITNYVVSNLRVDEIIYSVPDVSGMYVIPCGPVPPNPGEILLDDKIDELFAELKSRFDVIIIDSAPVGLVSDGISLAKHANATVYIVRHNYTFKKQIQLVDEIFVNKRLPHLSIVINDIKISGGYGGYYGYGYGYGFGQQEGANQYFQGRPAGKRNLRSLIQKIFKF